MLTRDLRDTIKQQQKKSKCYFSVLYRGTYNSFTGKLSHNFDVIQSSS